MKLNQKGFSAVEGMLAAIIVLLLAFGGYYIFTQNDDSDESETTADSSEEMMDDATEEEAEPARSDFWLRAESGQGGFSVSLPDGWKVVSDNQSDLITVRGSVNTVFEDGTQAEVTTTEGFGTDGPGRLTVVKFGPDDNFVFLDGDEEDQGEFEAANATGTKFYKQYPDTPTEGIGPLPGQQSYTYRFEVDGTTTFVTYNIQEGEDDIIDIVEEMIATLTIN